MKPPGSEETAVLKPEGEGQSQAVESPGAAPASTFVVRFWQEWSAAGSRWRGRIEHVQSRRGVSFRTAEAMLAFIGSMGPMIEGVTAREEQDED